MASPNLKIIGLIAGNRQFPFLFARAARDQGYKIIAAGIVGDTSPLLYFSVDKFQYFKVGELKKLFEYFRQSAVALKSSWQVRSIRIIYLILLLNWMKSSRPCPDALRDRKADTIFAAVADRLKKKG